MTLPQYSITCILGHMSGPMGWVQIKVGNLGLDPTQPSSEKIDPLTPLHDTGKNVFRVYCQADEAGRERSAKHSEKSKGRNKQILRIYFIQFIMVRCELLIT